MDKITAMRYTALPDDSPYVQTFRMYYTQNGKEKSWDLLKVHDSVAIIIFNRTRDTLALVRQFRPGNAMHMCIPINRTQSFIPFSLIVFLCLYQFHTAYFILRV